MSVEHLFKLEGRVALVTGGNGGLGLGMALGLAEAGAHIAVAARNTEKTATALSQIEATGVKALGLTADISRESDITEMVAQTIEALGRLDILVNNAGMVVRKEPQDLNTEEWDQVLDVNLRAAFLAAKTGLPSHEAPRRRKNYQYRVHVLDFRGRWQRSPLLSQQGRRSAALQEPGGGLGQGQHSIQRHIAGLVHDRADLRHPG